MLLNTLHLSFTGDRCPTIKTNCYRYLGNIARIQFIQLSLELFNSLTSDSFRHCNQSNCLVVDYWIRILWTSVSLITD